MDGIDSGDPVIGWGPRSGYVFQKGFVEFFCETKDVDELEKRLDMHGKGWVHLIASNYKVLKQLFALFSRVRLNQVNREKLEPTYLKVHETR